MAAPYQPMMATPAALMQSQTSPPSAPSNGQGYNPVDRESNLADQMLPADQTPVGQLLLQNMAQMNGQAANVLKNYGGSLNRASGAMAGATRMMDAAANQYAQAHKNFAEETEKAKAHADTAVALFRTQLQGLSDAHKNTVDSLTKDLDAKRKELLTEVDPYNWVKKMTPEQRSSFNNSVLLVSIGSALMGNPHGAAQLIEQRINADIKQQLSKKEGLRDFIDTTKSMLDSENRQYVDERTAIELRKAASLELYNVGLERQKMLLSSAQQKANISEAQANIRVRQAQLLNDVANQRASMALKQQQMARESYQNYEKAYAENASEQQLYANAGLAGTPISKSAAAQASKRVQELRSLYHSFDKLEKSYEGYTFMPAKKDELRLLAKDIQGKVTRYLNLGVPSHKDFTFLEAFIPSDPDNYFKATGRINTRITEAKKILREEMGLAAQSANMHLIDSQGRPLGSSGLQEVPTGKP